MKPKSKDDRRLIGPQAAVLVVSLLPIAYGLAYWGLTARGNADPEEQIDWGHQIIPRYPNDSSFERVFFAPMHAADRWLRPEYWTP